MKDYYLLLLESRNEIIYLQSSLESKEKNYFQLVPAPCSLKSGYGCNYALRISNEKYFPMLKNEIIRLNLGKPKMYLVDRKENKPKYIEVEFVLVQ